MLLISSNKKIHSLFKERIAVRKCTIRARHPKPMFNNSMPTAILKRFGRKMASFIFQRITVFSSANESPFRFLNTEYQLGRKASSPATQQMQFLHATQQMQFQLSIQKTDGSKRKHSLSDTVRTRRPAAPGRHRTQVCSLRQARAASQGRMLACVWLCSRP